MNEANPTSEQDLIWALERVKTFDPSKGLMPYQKGMIAMAAEIERLQMTVQKLREDTRTGVRSMSEMADMALEEMEDEELDRLRWKRGEISDAEAYELGIIDELGNEISGHD